MEVKQVRASSMRLRQTLSFERRDCGGSPCTEANGFRLSTSDLEVPWSVYKDSRGKWGFMDVDEKLVTYTRTVRGLYGLTLTFQRFWRECMWVDVKIMIPFLGTLNIRCRIIIGPKKGP